MAHNMKRAMKRKSETMFGKAMVEDLGGSQPLPAGYAKARTGNGNTQFSFPDADLVRRTPIYASRDYSIYLYVCFCVRWAR